MEYTRVLPRQQAASLRAHTPEEVREALEGIPQRVTPHLEGEVEPRVIREMEATEEWGHLVRDKVGRQVVVVALSERRIASTTD